MESKIFGLYKVSNDIAQCHILRRFYLMFVSGNLKHFSEIKFQLSFRSWDKFQINFMFALCRTDNVVYTEFNCNRVAFEFLAVTLKMPHGQSAC